MVTLGSGSKGNATYIGDGSTGVLVDCGISARQIFQRLEQAGLGDAPIDGVLITHEHTDHVAAARILCDKLKKRRGRDIEFFMTRGTRAMLHDKVVPAHARAVTAGKPFQIGDWTIEPHRVPHDTRDPVAYAINTGVTRVGVITDLGHVTRLVQTMLASLDVAVVEFNHDEQMLMDGSYPWSLKQRIRGRHGHLSNRQAADMVAEAATPRLQHLVLAHLSDENNRPVRAAQAAEWALKKARLSGVTITVADQRVPIPPIMVRSPMIPAATPKRSAPSRARRVRPAAVTSGDQQVSLFG